MRSTRNLMLFLLGLATVPAGLSAQITSTEYAARRNALAAKIDSGIVVAFGGRTLVSDFSRFFQLASFHYLTGYDEPDAAFVMVVHGGRPTTTLFVTKLPARTAFYYGQRADTAMLAQSMGVNARSVGALTAMVDSRQPPALPVYNLADYEDADFAGPDSLTRGGQFIKEPGAQHPGGLMVRNAHTESSTTLRANEEPRQKLPTLKKAAEISSEGPSGSADDA